MGQITIKQMKKYLSKSISSFNANKLNGLLAEIKFREYINELGYSKQVSLGGWIARCNGQDKLGHHTIAFFPEIIKPGVEYNIERELPNPDHGLHTICSTFHQIGIQSYYCTPIIDNAQNISWKAIQLGVPTQQEYKNFPSDISNFCERSRKHNFLRYDSDISGIPNECISEEFSKENIRVAFQNMFFAEVSDIDGIFWGQQYTYPIEIKEKTAANDKRFGDYFGLDVGPFVKLAYYSAKKGNMHSLFIVREIDDITTRNLVNWWYVTYETLAQYASWVFTGGGTNMRGGNSAVVRIPKSAFKELNSIELAKL